MKKNINKNFPEIKINKKQNIFDKKVNCFLSQFESSKIKFNRMAKDFLEKKNYAIKNIL
jgi:hypothetical protein